VKVGVPTEIKTDEYRVALSPSGVRELSDHGHEVFVQAGAGDGSAISDADYAGQGARIVPDAEALFGEADLIVKVKEPQAAEIARLEARHTLFTYLHLAPDPGQTQGLLAARSPRRPAPSCSRSRWAAAGCCSAACPASQRAR
jgi:alanine dehydrogenase